MRLIKWIILQEFKAGPIWNESSQWELIRSSYKQNPLLNVVLMVNGMYHRKGIWLLPYEIMFMFQIWLKQCSPDNLNYIYIMAQFWHFFCSIFYTLNDALQPSNQWMFLSCLVYIGGSYAPTIFMVLGILWPHTFQMYDFQTFSPYLLNYWNSLPPCYWSLTPTD